MSNKQLVIWGIMLAASLFLTGAATAVQRCVLAEMFLSATT